MKNKGLIRYYSILCAFVVVMLLVKLAMPGVAHPNSQETIVVDVDTAKSVTSEYAQLDSPEVNDGDSCEADPLGLVHNHLAISNAPKHRILSVSSYATAFPDLNDVQLTAARKNGIKPIADRDAAENAKSGLVYIGASPYYDIDTRMKSSIPFLVPKASRLLTDIAVAFHDSLVLKHIPLQKLIVTSALRTDKDVEELRRHNGNAVPESCHRFATTIDITYWQCNAVSDPDGPQRREVRNDTLKYVLSEVLDDFRKAGRCYVKHEGKQSCFHITVR